VHAIHHKTHVPTINSKHNTHIVVKVQTNLTQPKWLRVHACSRLYLCTRSVEHRVQGEHLTSKNAETANGNMTDAWTPWQGSTTAGIGKNDIQHLARVTFGIIAVLISASTQAITVFYTVSHSSSIQAISGLSQFGQDRFPSYLLPHTIACDTDGLRCTTSGCQVAMATKLRTVESSICGS